MKSRIRKTAKKKNTTGKQSVQKKSNSSDQFFDARSSSKVQANFQGMANNNANALSLRRVKKQADIKLSADKKASPLQRKARYSGYYGDQTESLIRALRNFQTKEQISSEEALSRGQMLKGLVKMDQRSEFFGEFDLSNYQQVALLYHQVKRQSKGSESEEAEQELVDHDKPFKKKAEEEASTFGSTQSPTLNVTGFYKLALLGSGSSIGYYVTSLGKSYDHQYTITIGKENPWKQKRGRIPFVNHPMEVIEPWGKEAPESQFESRSEEFSHHNPEDVFASRREFANKTQTAIASAMRPTQFIDGSVKKVSKVIDLDEPTMRRMIHGSTSTFNYKELWDALEWRLKGNNFSLFDYVVETEAGEFYMAHKVVMGTGGGPHTVPAHTKIENITDERVDSSERKKKRTVEQAVMDMDTFIRLPKRDLLGKRVVVQGTNAAIDAADWAIENGAQLVAWLGSKPPFLYKTLLKNAPSSAVEEKRVSAARNSEAIAIQADGTLRISFTINRGETTTVNSPVTADYFVYGIGQDITAKDEDSGTSGPEAMLSEEALEKLRTEEAVIKGDSGGVFSQEYGLGLHIGDNKKGLTVLGAAAWRLSGRDTRGKLDKMANVVPSNVLSYEQLAALKSSTGALNAYMPEYISKGFNWMTDDDNMIVAYLTIQHPGTPTDIADGFIQAVIQLRRLYPNGVPESVKQNLLEGNIRENMATQMALETAIFLRDSKDRSEEEMVATLKSILLFLVPEKAERVARAKEHYGSDYKRLESMLNIWLDGKLPNKSIAKKKSTD